MIDSVVELTLEERAKIEEIQDRLIECFVEHKQAAADGRERRAKELEDEINDLLAEKQEIEKWAVVGSA
jgi:flagellar basal body-associated protein FliL